MQLTFVRTSRKALTNFFIIEFEFFHNGIEIVLKDITFSHSFFSIFAVDFVKKWKPFSLFSLNC